MKFKFKKPSKKLIIWALVVVAIIAVIFIVKGFKGKAKPTSAIKNTAIVTKGDVPVTVSGSGVVEPISRYDIVPLVQGTIVDSPYEEGDIVKEGDVLYRFDSTDLLNNIQKSKNSLAKNDISINSRKDEINKLTIKAPADGIISDFSLKVGDQIPNGKIASIINNDHLVAQIPFNKSQYDKINVGDSAVLTSAQYMTTIDGKVTYKADSTTTAGDGSVLYEVEIELTNPGAFTENVSVGATVYTSSGSVTSPASGKTDNKVATTVVAETTGKVKTVSVKNNQRVSKGDVILTIDNSTLHSSLEEAYISKSDAELGLNSTIKSLEDYNITSPIDGTVITKNNKKGDNIGQGANSTILMTVADMSKMIFNLEVDELDITKVKIGLAADITADALPKDKFVGRVSKIANEGVASNGVTTYTVEITIDEPGALRSGMNVNADIVVDKATDVLMVPVSAIVNASGDSAFVYVKDESAKASNEPSGKAAGKGKKPAFPAGNANPGGALGNKASSTGTSFDKGVQAPQGYRAVRVVTGLSNDENIEIKNGLKEGQEVWVNVTDGVSSSMMSQMMMMGGGGAPGGGAPGGAPGGQSGGQNTKSKGK